ncbi:acyl carrier protein [Mycoplasma sp. ATU-Cv-703]
MNVKKMVFEKLKTLTNQKFDTNSEVLAIGIDSLDLVELITDVEEQLKIAISDQELESIKTIEDIITTIEKKLPSRK